MRKRGSAPVRRGNRLSLELGPENALTRIVSIAAVQLYYYPVRQWKKPFCYTYSTIGRCNTIGVKCVPDSNVVSVFGV